MIKQRYAKVFKENFQSNNWYRQFRNKSNYATTAFLFETEHKNAFLYLPFLCKMQYNMILLGTKNKVALALSWCHHKSQFLGKIEVTLPSKVIFVSWNWCSPVTLLKFIRSAFHNQTITSCFTFERLQRSYHNLITLEPFSSPQSCLLVGVLVTCQELWRWNLGLISDNSRDS